MATPTEVELSDDLLFAARSDDFDEVKSCIDKGANINYAESYGKSTPLHYGMYFFFKKKTTSKHDKT